jgi:hypothetical protein
MSHEPLTRHRSIGMLCRWFEGRDQDGGAAGGLPSGELFPGEALVHQQVAGRRFTHAVLRGGRAFGAAPSLVAAVEICRAAR